MNTEPKTNVLIIILMAIMVVVLIAVGGLFYHMNLMQQQIQKALVPGNLEQEGLETGLNAPDFSLVNVNGQISSVKDFSGNNLLLVFFSPNCSACEKMLPFIKDLSQDIQVAMISRESLEKNQQMVTDKGINFPVLVWNDTVAQDYKVAGTPFFYIIDQDGRIKNHGFAGTREELAEFIGKSN